jgi:hypothetical protein
MTTLPLAFEDGSPAPVAVCFPPQPGEHDASLGFSELGESAGPLDVGEVERLADALKTHLHWISDPVKARSKDPARLAGLRCLAWLWALDRRLLDVETQSALAAKLRVSKQHFCAYVKAARRLLRKGHEGRLT